jgi:hypothetical protein
MEFDDPPDETNVGEAEIPIKVLEVPSVAVIAGVLE